MRALLGWFLVAIGVALGVYLGLFVCFVGGIIDVVESIQATPISSAGIALGVVKVIFASFVGVMSALVLIVPGAAMTRENG